MTGRREGTAGGSEGRDSSLVAHGSVAIGAAAAAAGALAGVTIAAAVRYLPGVVRSG